jgi:hypothetical protein
MQEDVCSAVPRTVFGKKSNNTRRREDDEQQDVDETTGQRRGQTHHMSSHEDAPQKSDRPHTHESVSVIIPFKCCNERKRTDVNPAKTARSFRGNQTKVRSIVTTTAQPAAPCDAHSLARQRRVGVAIPLSSINFSIDAPIIYLFKLIDSYVNIKYGTK